MEPDIEENLNLGCVTLPSSDQDEMRESIHVYIGKYNIFASSFCKISDQNVTNVMRSVLTTVFLGTGKLKLENKPLLVSYLTKNQRCKVEFNWETDIKVILTSVLQRDLNPWFQLWIIFSLISKYYMSLQWIQMDDDLGGVVSSLSWRTKLNYLLVRGSLPEEIEAEVDHPSPEPSSPCQGGKSLLFSNFQGQIQREYSDMAAPFPLWIRAQCGSF